MIDASNTLAQTKAHIHNKWLMQLYKAQWGIRILYEDSPLWRYIAWGFLSRPSILAINEYIYIYVCYLWPVKVKTFFIIWLKIFSAWKGCKSFFDTPPPQPQISTASAALLCGVSSIWIYRILPHLRAIGFDHCPILMDIRGLGAWISRSTFFFFSSADEWVKMEFQRLLRIFGSKWFQLSSTSGGIRWKNAECFF